MIITKDLIFVHIPKTGGKSIGRAYKDKYGIKEDIFNYDFVNDKPLAKPHMTAKGIRELVGSDNYDKALKVSIIRNPFDRMVSFYFYGQRKLKKGCFDSFDEFIKYVCSDNYNKTYNAWNNAKIRQDQFLNDDIDILLSFEDEGVNEAFELLDLGEPLHVNKSNHRHYLEYYTDQTTLLVNDYFKKEIELFYT